MNFHERAIEADRLDLNAIKLFSLQLREQPIQHPRLRPAIDASVNRMPVAKAFGQCAPLTSILGDVQNRIDHVQIQLRDVASLVRQILFVSTELAGVISMLAAYHSVLTAPALFQR